MPHPPARGGSPAGNKANNGLGHRTRLVVALEELGGLLLARPADLADEYDALRGRVVEEEAERLSVCRPRERVPPDADHERLPQPHRRRLCDRFVCQRAGAGDNSWVGR